LQFYLFLYFGKFETNLQNFTMRDLGLVRTPDFKADYGARFDTLEEAKAAYFYAKGVYDFKHGSDKHVAQLIDNIEDWPSPQCMVSIHGRDKLLEKLGGLSERLGDINMALSLYERSDTPRCNERVVRLRYRQGDKDWTERRLLKLIENPGSDEEHNFARDFYARKFKKKRTSLVTDILRGSEIIKLDEAYRNQPETAAKRYYEAAGATVYRTENSIWRMLFGLLFWEQLYGEQAKGIYNSFERIPALLKSGEFYSTYREDIESKLNDLTAPEFAFIDLLKTMSRHHNTPNSIFRWRPKTLEKVKVLMSHAKPDALIEILRLMAQNYPQMKDGFPDLMCVENKAVRFVEIKAEGDVIRRNQLSRIQQLRAAGFPTDITRVEWMIDPDQVYVVVDVETTGGRAGLHRVTEIGAVKMQGGKVIGEWQSLLKKFAPAPPCANSIRVTSLTASKTFAANLISI